MEKLPIYSFNSYRALLSHFLLGNKQRGQLSRAAEHLNCQRSYLSRVIKGDAHLTLDQAYLLSQFWKFTNDERDYFSSLVEYDRAGVHEYKTFLKKRLDEMKKKHETIQERTQRQSYVVDNMQINYFSSWISCALQFLTMIPQFQNVEALADRLSLKKEIVSFYLDELQKLDFVEFKNNKWINKSSNLHIPKESPLVQLHHNNWRGRAQLDSQNINTDHIHFTGVYTLSFDDYHRIKEMLLAFISDANKIIGPSQCEEGVVLLCDFFKI